MSGWSEFFEDVPSLPASLPDRRPTKLPEAGKLARSLRNGKTVNDLAVHYGYAARVIHRRLTDAGWDTKTGQYVGSTANTGAPLSVRGGGPGTAVHHVGGGDNPNVVPLVARPIRERPKSTGFPWPERPDVPFPTVPQIKRRPRTQTPARRRVSEARRKLTPAMRADIARRYENLESSVALAAEYGVNQRTIRNALREQGVHVRTRSEAGYLRWAANHPEEAAERAGTGDGAA